MAKKMSKLPHVIFVELIKAEGLALPADTYVLVNSIEKHKHKESCFSTVKSDVVSNSATPVYDEEVKVYLANRACKVVLNVFSSSWTGDSLMGQAVIDISNYPTLYTKGEITVPIGLNISKPKYIVYDSNGQAMTTHSKNEQGKIFVKLRVPPMTNNMVGLFWNIDDHAGLFYNDVKGTKILIELCEETIFVFEGAVDYNQVFDTKKPRDGITVKKISVADIVSVEESQSHEVEITFDRLLLTMVDGSVLNWAWGGDSRKFKNYWRKCFRTAAAAGEIKFKSSQSIKDAKHRLSSSQITV